MILKNINLEENLILRKISDKVNSKKELNFYKKEIIELKKELKRNSSTVGIAAPQIGLLKRIILIKQFGKQNEKGEYQNFKEMLLINPEIIAQGEEIDIGIEGCLSVPNVEKKVIRKKTIKVSYLDENFSKKYLYAEELNARIILHEIDHLNGILFIDY